MLSRNAIALALVLGGSISPEFPAQGVEAQATVVAQAGQERKAEADRLLKAGEQATQKRQFEAAEKYLQTALSLYLQLQNRSSEGNALYSLGDVYYVQQNYRQAIAFYQQALVIRRETNDRCQEARTLNDLGLSYSNLGEKQKALDYYNQSLPITRALGNRGGEASTLNNIGLLYSNLDENQKALNYYNQALLIWKAVNNHREEANTLNNIGLVYHHLNQNQQALNYYNQALPILKTVGDSSTAAITLNNIGLVYHVLGETQKALDYYNQALLIQKAVGNRSGEALTLNNIGGVYRELKENQRALDYYRRALPIWKIVGDPSGQATTLSNIGLVYYDLGEQQKGLDHYNQALPIHRAVGNRSMEATTLNHIGSLLVAQKQPELAIAFYKESVNVYESIRQDIRKLPRETQEIYTSSVAGTYRKLADLLLTQGRSREAQAILELLKVQELQSYGKDQDNSPPIQFPLHPLETQALQASEKSIAAQSFSLETLKTIAQPLVQNRDRITQESNNTPSAIGDPQAVLNANLNALLIQNLVVGDKLWVIWTNANGKTTAIVVPNVTQEQLNSTVQKFRDQIGSPYSNLTQLKATSTQLYNWLIPPQLQAELVANPKQHLIFSLDHVTRYIPVAALFDGTQYLAQGYTLSNLITTDSDTTDRLARDGRSPTILALGTSKAYPGFDPLPNVDAELHAIVRDGNSRGIYPGKIKLNAAFTANTLRDNLNAFRVLHIATHGSFNPKSITASFLLLGDGNRLPITDIAALTNFNTTHLVVLSACETGISGSAQDGTEISGISGYFLRRGAKSVLASLWSVNDASTSLLMQQFYKNMAAGKLTKAEALRQGQLNLLQSKLIRKDAPVRSDILVTVEPGSRAPSSSADFSHPYYWAPFILIGNSL
jgi:CHAT domain-containing protein/Flp pilus assembly protein TadD